MHHRTSCGAFTLVAGGLTLASAAENVYGIDWEEPQRNDGNIVAMILIVMIHVCGFLGNSLLLLSIRNDPTLRSSLSGLMVCALSGTDMMYEAALIITLPFTMGQYPSYTVCQVQGFYIHALCAASIMILFIITVERYRLVVKNTATSRAAIKQGLAAAFIMAIMFAALPLFGFGHYELQPSKVFCFARGGYGVPSDDWYCIVASVIILNTTVGMILMYSMIWRLINRFHISTGAALSDRTNQTRNKAEREIVKQFIVITSLFVLFWTPALIKFVSEPAAQIVVEHAWFDVIAAMGAALNSASNPIAYGIMNKNIRLAVRAQLRRTFPRLRRMFSTQGTPQTPRSSVCGYVCSLVQAGVLRILSDSAAQVIVITDAGQDLDDEMSLVLLQALTDKGIVECKGAVATLAPSRDRARLVRGSLDVLGLRNVPVAIGTDGGSNHHSNTFEETANGYIPADDHFHAPSGLELLVQLYTLASPASLELLCIASMKDAAEFVCTHEQLFVEKTRSVTLMGGVLPFDDDDMLLVPDTAHNNQFCTESSDYLYRRCQELKVKMVIVSRHAAYACPMPRSIYDDMAATGHPIGLRLRDTQRDLIESLWKRACATGADRLGLPARCDKQWFQTTFLQQRGSDRTIDDSIWDLVSSFMM